MSDNAGRESETPGKGTPLVDWNRVLHVTVGGATTSAEREPTCLEWVIANTIANAVAVANAPFCCGGRDEPEFAGVDLRKVVALVAEQTVAGMLDDAIFVLREVLKCCVKRGDSSVYAVETAEETRKPETTKP